MDSQIFPLGLSILTGVSLISIVFLLHLGGRLNCLESQINDLIGHQRRLSSDLDKIEDYIQDQITSNDSDPDSNEEVEGEVNAWKSRPTEQTEMMNDPKKQIKTEEELIQFLSGTISVIKDKLLEVNSDDPEKKDMINNLFGLITSQTERLTSGTDREHEDSNELSRELLKGTKSILESPKS